MFQWCAHGVPLMVAPIVSSPRQAYSFVDVSVREETAPVYALVFTVSHESQRIERRVTKQLMARVFERVIALPRGPVTTLRTRLLNHKDTRVEAFDDAVDTAVRAWICAETVRPPTREQLVKWLLSRILLYKTSDGWALRLCGESDEEDPEVAERTDNSQQEPTPTVETEHALGPTSPPPPPYSAGSNRSERTLSDSSDFPAFFEDLVNAGGGDQGEVAPDGHHVDSLSKSDELDDQTLQARPNKPHTTTIRDFSKEKRPSYGQDDDREDSGGIPLPSSYRFEPARERIDSQRRHSRSSWNAWSEEQRHIQLELTQSKRDIEIAQERQRKAQAIASLRWKHTAEQNQKKLLAHEQKLRDARLVKQGLADTLEYHDIASRMESQLKQTRIASYREQEKLTQSTRVALGCGGDKWQKGPVIGAGPLSQIEIDLLTQGDRKPRAQPSMWVYDLHGRRHHESHACAVEAGSAFDAAMKKIQRLLDRKGTESVDLFRRHDLDHSGTLEYGEFRFLLGEHGVELSPEQAATLFRHFDPNRSGAIDYGELLWGFFNRRSFLKRWTQRKTKLSAREIKQMFYKYDQAGRGALAPLDFLLALGDIGFRVSDSEVKLLCLRFDTNKDGFIDYNEFHAFVNDDVVDDSGSVHSTRDRILKSGSQAIGGQWSEERSSPHKARRHSTNANTKSHGASDVARILAELRTLNETQATIRRSLAATH